MTAMFLGGAAGSAGATAVWRLGGWNAVCGFGVALSGLALALEILRRVRRR